MPWYRSTLRQYSLRAHANHHAGCLAMVSGAFPPKSNELILQGMDVSGAAC